MASSAGAAPLVSADVERGDGQVKEVPQEQDFMMAYYVVYAFSLVFLVLGTYASFVGFSESGIVGRLSGTGGLVTGLFLMLNTDLLVTYLRLMHEMRRFKQSNKMYRQNLVEQKKKVKKLKAAEKALRRLDALCHGQMESFQSEMDEMTSTSRDNTRRNIAGVLMMMRPKQDDVTEEELDEVARTFCFVYARIFPDIEERFAEMRKGLEASPKFQKEKALSNTRLKFMLEDIIFEELGDIKDHVHTKAEAKSDERVSGWHQSSADSVNAQKWAGQFQENGGRLSLSAVPENSAAGGTDDDWADAEAFAGGGSGQEKKPARQSVGQQADDDWADAMAFADK